MAKIVPEKRLHSLKNNLFKINEQYLAQGPIIQKINNISIYQSHYDIHL